MTEKKQYPDFLDKEIEPVAENTAENANIALKKGDSKARLDAIVAEIWERFDIDRDGTLDKQEFKRFALMRLKENNGTFEEARFDKLFDELDFKHTGVLDKDEMYAFIKRVL